MKITHREYGEVDYVTPCGAGWHKFERGRSSRFMPDDGWSEVLERKCVDVTDSLRITTMGGVQLDGFDASYPPRNCYFEKASMCNLPYGIYCDAVFERLGGRYGAWHHTDDVKAWIEKFRRTCLVVKRMEGG